MAATEILPVADTAANSGDVTVVAGEPITVALKGAVDGAAKVHISLKDDAGFYQPTGYVLESSSERVIVISGPGTYRFSRQSGGVCGVFSA